jgi:hypothetical protein
VCSVVLLRKIEIWQLEPKPRKVASVGEELFEEYLEKKKRLVPNDLGTNWFGRMMATIFRNSRAVIYFTVVDVTGTSRSIFERTTVVANPLFNTVYNYDCGAYIGVGTGSTPPTKTDYKLVNEVSRQPAAASFTDGTDTFAVYAAFTLASDTDIYEVGLYWKEGYNGWVWLLDRTVLPSPVRFPANTAMSVAYVFAI